MYQVSIQRDDREGREDREEVEVDKGDLEVQQNPPVVKRTWLQSKALDFFRISCPKVDPSLSIILATSEALASVLCCEV